MGCSSPCVIWKFSDTARLSSYSSKKRMVLEDSYQDTFSSLPGILSDRAFIIVYSRKNKGTEVFIILYKFNESNPPLEAHKVRIFRLPDLRKNFHIAGSRVASRATIPTYTGSRARFESLASRSIYSDHEQLSATTFVLSPQTVKIHYHCFFAYPSTFLSSRYGDMTEVPWESWGAKNAAFFWHQPSGSAIGQEWYHRGDQVAVIHRTGPASNGLYMWLLCVLDFRPARVRRAQLVARGQQCGPHCLKVQRCLL
jgi:hypothetical protein